MMSSEEYKKQFSNSQEYKLLNKKPRRVSTNAEQTVDGDAMPIKVNVNPLSVNKAWKGKRMRSDDYKAYRNYLMHVLPSKLQLPDPPYEIRINFGLSSVLSDWDNPVKPFQDILQELYGFNDKLIKRAVVEVEKVPKNEEFIRFEIVHLNVK